MTTSGGLNAIAFNSSDPGELQERGVRGLADVDAVVFVAASWRRGACRQARRPFGLGAESGDDNLQAVGEDAAGRGVGGDAR